MEIKYQSRQDERSESGRSDSITYYGSYEEMTELLEAQRISPETSGRKVISAVVSQSDGSLWQCEIKYQNTLGNSSVSAPDDSYGKKSAQLTCGMLSMALGGSSGIDKYYDLKWDTNLPEEQRMKNAMLTGFINSGAAWLTAGIVKGKIPALNRVQFKNEFMAATSYFLSATGLEAGQEAMEQLAENAADLHTGVYGDVSKMSPEDYRKHLWNGVGESSLAGGVSGLGGGLIGFRSFRDRQKFTHQVIGGLESERERLMRLENPGEEEVKRLQEINTALDAGNPDQLAAAALALAEREAETAKAQEADGARKREQEIEEAETPDLGYEIADGMDKETVLKAKEAEEWLALRNTLRHNPQDTEDAVAEASVFYRDTAFHIVHGREDYPADVRSEMERIGKNPDQIRAFTYAGNVYVNADRVRPSEVPALLLHEVVGHKGLRAVFGKDFDLLLDSVVKEHLNDEDFRRIAEQYQCDLETVDGARYAAEEYLARYAEQHGAGIKPKWWKEMLQQIRVFLSKHHLYRNVRFTDAEIEVALARSIRHARLRDREIARSRDVRFAAALRREGAPNTAGERGQLRDGNVPHRKGFLQEYGFDGKGIYADYEFLRGRHPEYFPDVEHVRAAVEFVLDAPEPGGHILGNSAFVRQDMYTGL